MAAKKLNLDTTDLYQWAHDDPILQSQLEQRKNSSDAGVYSDHALGNKADIHGLAEVRLGAKRHEK